MVQTGHPGRPRPRSRNTTSHRLPVSGGDWGPDRLAAGLGSQLPHGAGNQRGMLKRQVLVSNLTNTAASLTAGAGGVRNALTKFASIKAAKLMDGTWQ